MSTISLPDDVWLLVCEELARRRDFDSLFQCAQSRKALASFALSYAYRFYSEARIRDDEVEGRGFTISEQQQLFLKWAIQWRSIILSTFGKTILPYYSFIRFLNLRDLKNLLEDSKFKPQVSRYFFEGELSSFHKQRKAFNRNVLDLQTILDLVGDAITAKNQTIEQLSGDFSSTAFLSWIPRLSRLQNLELWDGTVLSNAEVRKAIHEHCPMFESLSIFRWLVLPNTYIPIYFRRFLHPLWKLRMSPDADSQLGSFISDLPTNRLKSFENISRCGVSSNTCLALSLHADSLKDLKITFADAEDVAALSHLKTCISLERLQLEAPVTVDLEAQSPEAFKDVNEWLANCVRLKSLTLGGFSSPPSLLTPLLLNNRVRLEKLEVDSNYLMVKHRTFHQALGQHTSLAVLSLKGDSEDAVREDIEALVHSICQLKQLKDLRLQGVAEYFADDHLLQILPSLHELTDLYIGGYWITDASLDAVLSLRNLHEITFNAITYFTFEGLLDFVSKLSPSNEELRLVVDNADPSTLLSEDEISMVRNAIFEKVGGSFEYIPLRDPNMPEFDTDSE